MKRASKQSSLFLPGKLAGVHPINMRNSTSIHPKEGGAASVGLQSHFQRLADLQPGVDVPPAVSIRDVDGSDPVSPAQPSTGAMPSMTATNSIMYSGWVMRTPFMNCVGHFIAFLNGVLLQYDNMQPNAVQV